MTTNTVPSSKLSVRLTELEESMNNSTIFKKVIFIYAQITPDHHYW